MANLDWRLLLLIPVAVVALTFAQVTWDLFRRKFRGRPKS